jgi:hypothetical protein
MYHLLISSRLSHRISRRAETETDRHGAGGVRGSDLRLRSKSQHRQLNPDDIMQTRRFSQISESSESPLTELESEDHSPPRKRRRRKTKVFEPVVYEIPPVESRTTTYRGIVSPPFILPAENSGPLT